MLSKRAKDCREPESQEEWKKCLNKTVGVLANEMASAFRQNVLDMAGVEQGRKDLFHD